jgi:hypothetical protein
MSGTPHVPAGTGRPGAEFDDLSIPVLTDRIYLPALELDIALPATTTARMAGIAPHVATAATGAAPAVPMPGGKASAEVIGATDRPFGAAAVEHAVVEDEAARTAGNDSSPPAATGAARGSPAEIAPKLLDDYDADIETELDRDLIAALNADFEAMLAAESDLDAAADDTTKAFVERNAPADDAAAATTAAFPTADATVEPTVADAGGTAGEAEAAAEREQTAETAAETPPETAAAADFEADVEADVEAGVPEADTTADVGEQLETAPAHAHSAETPEAADDVQPTTTAPQQQASADRDASAQRALADEAEGLRTAVLESVAQRLPAHIDMTLRELMQPAINEAIVRLGEDAQVALRIAMQELVEQVLREELDRRQPNSSPH